MRFYDGKKDCVWEEFVADTLSGMNEYIGRFIDTVVEYWDGNEDIDNFDASKYTNTIDAGGTSAEVTQVTEFEGNEFMGEVKKNADQINRGRNVELNDLVVDSDTGHSTDARGLFNDGGNGAIYSFFH